MIVLGDARTNGRDPRADLFHAVAERAGRTFWLNPEPKLYWNYGDSVVSAYEPFCSAARVLDDAPARGLRQGPDAPDLRVTGPRRVGSSFPTGEPVRTVALDVALALAVAVCAGSIAVLWPARFRIFDAFFALVWGEDLLHGRTPDSASPPGRFSAPHPLVNAVPRRSCSPLGRAARVNVLQLADPLVLGSAARLACSGSALPLYAWPVGLIAAAVMTTRVPTLVLSGRTFVDIPAAALIVWAAVLEARRPRRGAPVLVLLALAGLLRAETWLLSLAYLDMGGTTAPMARSGSGWPHSPSRRQSSGCLAISSSLAAPSSPPTERRSPIAETRRLCRSPWNSPTGLLAVPDALARDMGNWLQHLLLARAGRGSAPSPE